MTQPIQWIETQTVFASPQQAARHFRVKRVEIMRALNNKRAPWDILDRCVNFVRLNSLDSQALSVYL